MSTRRRTRRHRRADSSSFTVAPPVRRVPGREKVTWGRSARRSTCLLSSRPRRHAERSVVAERASWDRAGERRRAWPGCAPAADDQHVVERHRSTGAEVGPHGADEGLTVDVELVEIEEVSSTWSSGRREDLRRGLRRGCGGTGAAPAATRRSAAARIDGGRHRRLFSSQRHGLCWVSGSSGARPNTPPVSPTRPGRREEASEAARRAGGRSGCVRLPASIQSQHAASRWSRAGRSSSRRRRSSRSVRSSWSWRARAAP